MATVVTPEEIKALGFTTQAFGSPADFEAYLQTIIDEQEGLLAIRIGVETVANETLKPHVSLAEKCLVAAELCQRRINRLIENINPDAPAIIDKIRKQQDKYLETAETAIAKLVSSPGETDSGGYSGGVVVTEHFTVGTLGVL